MRRSIRMFAALLTVLAVALPAVGLAASTPTVWSSLHGNPAETGFNAGEQSLRPVGLHIQWHTANVQDYIVGGERVFRYTQLTRSMGAPAAYDIATGRLRRVYTAATERFAGEMAYEAGRLYVGGSELTALDVQTGRVLWRARFGAGTVGVNFPIAVGNYVFVQVTLSANQNDVPYMVNATNGHILWSVHRTYAELPSFGPNRITIPFSGLSNHAIRDILATYDLRTGRQVWSVELPQYQAPLTWMLSNGFLISSDVFPEAYGGLAYTANGRLAWRNAHFLPQSAAYGLVYGIYVDQPPRTYGATNSINGYPAAVNVKTGRLEWVNRSRGFRNFGNLYQAAVANGVFYYANQQSNAIVAYAARTGKTLAVIPMPSGFRSCASPEVASGTLFALSYAKNQPLLGARASLFAFRQ